MSEPAIVPMHARPGRREYHRHRNRPSGINCCGTCRGTRGVRKFGHHAGFCADCLERSRVHDDDDLGGEG